jgi:glycerol uptake facilitator-like aquaporin
MESGIIAQKSYIFLALYEFFGCMIALIGINCSGNSAIVCAMSIFIAATLTGRVSGGHFNGAVTLGVYLVEGKWCKNLPIASLVFICDLLGAYAAMFISVGYLGSNDIFHLVPPETRRNAESFFYLIIVECFFTFVLVSIVLFVKYR